VPVGRVDGDTLDPELGLRRRERLRHLHQVPLLHLSREAGFVHQQPRVHLFGLAQLPHAQSMPCSTAVPWVNQDVNLAAGREVADEPPASRRA